MMKPEKPLALAFFTSRNLDALKAMQEGNKRNRIGKRRARVFPTSASEANNPQKVRSGW